MKTPTNTSMNFLLLPGAWLGAWIWDDFADELQSRNHEVHSLTLSGLHPDDKRPKAHISLETHVHDVIDYIEQHTLTDLVLVGHSYAGVVAGQVADRIPEKIPQLVFVEGIVPINGQNMLESNNNDIEAEARIIKQNNGLWLHPTTLELAQETALSEEQRNYMLKNLIDHPGKTVTDLAIIKHGEIAIPTLYVGRGVPYSAEKSVFKNATYIELDGGHWPMLTKPKELANIIVNKGARI